MVGTNQILEFFVSQYENTIAYAPDSKVCVIHRDYTYLIVGGETWYCRILRDKGKFYVVIPIERVRDRITNQKILMEKLDKLHSKHRK